MNTFVGLNRSLNAGVNCSLALLLCKSIKMTISKHDDVYADDDDGDDDHNDDDDNDDDDDDDDNDDEDDDDDSDDYDVAQSRSVYSLTLLLSHSKRSSYCQARPLTP